MKKIFAAVALLLVSSWAFAADFVEGKDYELITPAPPAGTGTDVEVIEFFMYTCPHCYHLEPMLKDWLKKKPENVKYEAMPAMFGGGANQFGKTHYALEAMGELDRIRDPLFAEIHEKKQRMLAQADIDKFLESQSVDMEKFRQALSSFTVETKANRAATLVKRYAIRGVPAFVVDGRYRVPNSEKVMQVVDFVINKTLQERAAK